MASRRKLAFLVDNCVMGEVVTYLSRLKKVKVVSFEAVGLTQGSSDEHVIEKAAKARALVVTGDKRFTEAHIPFCNHEGIVKFNVKPNARIRCLKKFLLMKERHQAWKGVTHLYDDKIEMFQHIGIHLSVPYSK